MRARLGAPLCGLFAATLVLDACGVGGSGSPVPPVAFGRDQTETAGTPIKHVVLMIQENRTFNNLFAGFPGAISTKTGKELVPQGSGYVEKSIALTEAGLTDHGNVTHLYKAFLTAWQNGAMDGFDLIKYPSTGKAEGKAPYQYVNPADTVPYWTMAAQYALAEKMFQTQGSDSFTAHQDLIRGGTFIDSDESLIDPPTTNAVWGCDSKPGAKTTLINTQLQVSYDKGPFPCTKDFPDYGSSGFPTLRDLLDAKSVSWKYYTPVWKNDTPSALWDAFDVIAPVRYGQEWTDGHIASPETHIFYDISHRTLPAMSWVIPDAQNSDHPGYAAKDTGPSWVAGVVNAIGESSYWKSTAIIIVWDDWGGFYDSVAPPAPRDDQGGPGFRVAMIVVSPYVPANEISKTVYEFGSIVRFIEDTWHLGRLGTTDETTTSIRNIFDFTQKPRQFHKISSPYSRSFFLHQQPSDLPVDTE